MSDTVVPVTGRGRRRRGPRLAALALVGAAIGAAVLLAARGCAAPERPPNGAEIDHRIAPRDPTAPDLLPSPIRHAPRPKAPDVAASRPDDGPSPVPPPEPGKATLRLRARQGGDLVEAAAHVSAGPTRICEVAIARSAPLPVVPANVDLDVTIDSFVGSRVLPAVAPQRVRLADGEERELAFELPAGVLVRFEAYDEGGHAMPPPFYPTLWRLDDGATPRSIHDVLVTGRDAGMSPVARLAPGRYVVGANWVGAGRQGSARLDVSEPGPVTVRIDVKARPGARRATRWLEADGKPSVGLRIVLSPTRDSVPSPDGAWAEQGVTDAEGRVAFAAVMPGPCDAYLWDRDLHRILEFGADEAGEAEIRLPPSYPTTRTSIHGTVRGPSGVAAAKTHLRIGRSGEAWARLGETDDQGEFESSDLPPGTVRIEVLSSWWSELVTRPYAETVWLQADVENRIEVNLRAPGPPP